MSALGLNMLMSVLCTLERIAISIVNAVGSKEKAVPGQPVGAETAEIIISSDE